MPRLQRWIPKKIGEALVGIGQRLWEVAQRLLGRPTPPSQPPPPTPVQPQLPAPPLPPPVQPPEFVQPPPPPRLPGEVAPGQPSPTPPTVLPPWTSPIPTQLARGQVPPEGVLLGQYRYLAVTPLESAVDSWMSSFKLIIWSDVPLSLEDIFARVVAHIQEIYEKYGRRFHGLEFSELRIGAPAVLQALRFW